MRMRRRGNWQKNFGQRFGKYDAKLKQAITNRHTLWMHAVSVGEVNICAHLIHALQHRIPNVKIVVSTTTTTGMERLHALLPAHISKIYYPVDLRRVIVRALSTIHPEAIVLVEAEVWPNFIWRACELGMPLFLVNARLSEKSFRGYRRSRFFFRPFFAALAGVGAQNEIDAARWRELGCRPEVIRNLGNIKFDAAADNRPLPERRRLDVPALLSQLGVAAGSPIIVAGSTHSGEEAILAKMFLRLRQRFPNLFLVLVPRHFERSRDVGRELSSLGVKYLLRSEVNSKTSYEPGKLHCLLVNTTGELKSFYEHATIVFVGKSLTAKGGQNPIEPCAFGKPTVFGPNMQNFSDIVRAFLAADGAIQVPNAEALETTFTDLLSNETRRNEAGARGLKVVQENLGATERTVQMILDQLKGTEIYIAPAK